MGACYLSMEMTASNEKLLHKNLTKLKGNVKFKKVLTHTMEPGVL